MMGDGLTQVFHFYDHNLSYCTVLTELNYSTVYCIQYVTSNARNIYILYSTVQYTRHEAAPTYGTV